jgi:3'(2'), 5'-bisphosphate nucleotidase
MTPARAAGLRPHEGPVSAATADDQHIARDIAELAGRTLVSVRQRLAEAGIHGRAMGDEGDRASQEVIAAELARLRPDDAVLSEEAPDSRSRLRARRVWVIDPLDGTREFSEPERTDWAVHVALVVDGWPAAAAVALPALGLLFDTATPPLLPSRNGGAPRIVVSRTRPPAVARALARRFGATLLPMGSAGAKAMAVVRGDADIYVHAGGQWEWDSAAPVGVAAAAGLHTSRLSGERLRYNRSHPWLPDLLVCRSEYAADVLSLLPRID